MSFIITPVYDQSVTALQSSDPTAYAIYTASVNAAIGFFESHITNDISLTINFDVGTFGNGQSFPAGADGASAFTSIEDVTNGGASVSPLTFSQIRSALEGADTQSTVQKAAAAKLATMNFTPGTGYTGFKLTTAEAKVLGLYTAADAQYYPSGPDGYVSIASTSELTNVAGDTSLFEHEISHILGRTSTSGTKSDGTFRPLDLFTYTSTGQLQPFNVYGSAGAYPSTAALTYFSYNGQVSTSGAGRNLQFDSPTLIEQGADTSSWDPSSTNVPGGDAFSSGSAGPVSQTDLDLLSVLGYDTLPVCYVAGTRIATADGEAPVETLRAGDLVRTASGAIEPVVWVGQRRIACARHPDPAKVWPIRIATGAFADGVPARDLWLSPAHSVCIDVLGEVLIPICALANGSTIQQIEVDQVTYWHVELDRHDILIANALPAESYIDMGNRRFFIESDVVEFDMAPDVNLLDPAERTPADFCRPFVIDGPILDAVRLQLRRRAEAMGWTLDAADEFGDLHLMVDGMRIDPVVRGLTARFSVPADAGDAWLVCNGARPCDVQASDDQRHLGVCLTRLAIDDGFGEHHSIALDSPLLGDGLFPLEDDCRRWTTGRTRLQAGLWEQCPNEFFLLAELAGPALPRWTRAFEETAACPQKPPLSSSHWPETEVFSVAAHTSGTRL